MPKSKVTKSSSPAPVTSASRTPVKINTSGTPMWYKIIMFAFMIVGLDIDFMLQLGAWNYLIGFTLLIIGLLMTMGWR